VIEPFFLCDAQQDSAERFTAPHNVTSAKPLFDEAEFLVQRYDCEIKFDNLAIELFHFIIEEHMIKKFKFQCLAQSLPLQAFIKIERPVRAPITYAYSIQTNAPDDLRATIDRKDFRSISPLQARNPCDVLIFRDPMVSIQEFANVVLIPQFKHAQLGRPIQFYDISERQLISHPRY
jgi:hypothetical protein